MSLITLSEVKEASSISHTAQDVFLQDLIDGVEDWAQRYLGQTFSSALHVEHMDGGGFALRPEHRPVTSVTEVYDTEASSVEDETAYDLVRDGIYRDNMCRWEEEPHNRWRVTYYGGEAMLAGVKAALIMLITRLRANPEGLSRQGAAGYGSGFERFLDTDVKVLLDPYRRGGIFIG